MAACPSSPGQRLEASPWGRCGHSCHTHQPRLELLLSPGRRRWGGAVDTGYSRHSDRQVSYNRHKQKCQHWQGAPDRPSSPPCFLQSGVPPPPLRGPRGPRRGQSEGLKSHPALHRAHLCTCGREGMSADGLRSRAESS